MNDDVDNANDFMQHMIDVGVKNAHDKIKKPSNQASKALACIDWKNAMLLCHNTQFDGTILKWTYGHEPAGYFDTLSMARALHGVDVGGSLKVLAERYKLGEKGTEVLNAKGKRLEDFQEYELHQYGLYCINDVELTYDLFKILSKRIPFF
jgi:DNA polymerase I-like protein with 3'-5' exonuclease and polymerase domains